jgi:4-hydroxy-tetrahydrodipicolinate synthase
MTALSGVWLPIITPFLDGAVDFASYERLLEYYLELGVDGIFPLGTTGESPTLDDDESESIVERTLAVVAGRIPVFVGVGGNATGKVLRTLRRLDRYDFTGIVSVCPYYNRPSQDGMAAHVRCIAEATDRKIVIYNIPYRTGVNLANDTLLALAEQPNIVGVKDSSGTRAITGTVAPPPAGLRGHDRRGQFLLHDARARRRRRHFGIGAHRYAQFH